MDIREVPIYIAREKAKSIQTELSHERIILAADTIVVLGGKVIGKPVDRSDAIDILSQLSGKKSPGDHRRVLLKGKKEIPFADVTDVLFHELTREQIAFLCGQVLTLR
jgi:septum formation protein